MSAVLDVENKAKLITADELLVMPNTRFGFELVCGELKEYMPTGMLHGIIATRIGTQLSFFVSENNLGVVLAAETGFNIFQNPDTVRAPDSAFIGKEKLKKYGLTEKFFPAAPDLAVEVVSPNDRKKDIESKIKDYLSAGVELIWVIYPKNKVVAVYRQNNLVSILRETDTLEGEEILPNFQLSLEKLFADLPKE